MVYIVLYSTILYLLCIHIYITMYSSEEGYIFNIFIYFYKNVIICVNINNVYLDLFRKKI